MRNRRSVKRIVTVALSLAIVTERQMDQADVSLTHGASKSLLLNPLARVADKKTREEKKTKTCEEQETVKRVVKQSRNKKKPKDRIV